MENSITYAIGDVHGRADLLDAVINHAIIDAAKHGAKPRFVFLGDICDRGARSRQAFDMVSAIISEHAGSFLIRGNHDDMFMNAIMTVDRQHVANWLANGGVHTLSSYHAGDMNDAFEIVSTLHMDHIRMLSSAQLSVLEDGICFTHAGINPALPLDKQSARDLMWIRDPFLNHVGHLPAIVVHGHTVVGDRPVVTENRVSIDTGAYKSGRLTVAVIQNTSFRFFQTDGFASSVVNVDPVLDDRGFGTVMDGFSDTALAVAA